MIWSNLFFRSGAKGILLVFLKWKAIIIWKWTKHPLLQQYTTRDKLAICAPFTLSTPFYRIVCSSKKTSLQLQKTWITLSSLLLPQLFNVPKIWTEMGTFRFRLSLLRFFSVNWKLYHSTAHILEPFPHVPTLSIKMHSSAIDKTIGLHILNPSEAGYLS